MLERPTKNLNFKIIESDLIKFYMKSELDSTTFACESILLVNFFHMPLLIRLASERGVEIS